MCAKIYTARKCLRLQYLFAHSVKGVLRLSQHSCPHVFELDTHNVGGACTFAGDTGHSFLVGQHELLVLSLGYLHGRGFRRSVGNKHIKCIAAVHCGSSNEILVTSFYFQACDPLG